MTTQLAKPNVRFLLIKDSNTFSYVVKWIPDSFNCAFIDSVLDFELCFSSTSYKEPIEIVDYVALIKLNVRMVDWNACHAVTCPPRLRKKKASGPKSGIGKTHYNRARHFSAVLPWRRWLLTPMVPSLITLSVMVKCIKVGSIAMCGNATPPPIRASLALHIILGDCSNSVVIPLFSCPMRARLALIFPWRLLGTLFDFPFQKKY